LNFVIAGEGFPAAKVLETVTAEPHARVVGVFTDLSQPRRLKSLAEAAGAGLHDARSLATPAAADVLARLEPHWLLNANSTVIIDRAALAVPSSGCLNLHPGLLPRYAGLHTHQWAIRNGESEFGATIHFIAPELDAGDVVSTVRFPIKPSDTGLSLFQRCIDAGVSAMSAAVQDLLAGKELPRTPQDLSNRRIYRHRDALDARVDWTMPARAVVDFVRAGNYEPFQSPSYTAELDAPRGDPSAPKVLVATAAGAGGGRAGTIGEWRDTGPAVTCGDGTAVVLAKIVWNGRKMTREDWDSYCSLLRARSLRGKDAERGP
jgi:UDP-4-amino-4-deoxy-L-arabinose formyltransferase/UDP-glucuronic acid dehydrogenase (UDP-4-keto-hexauronic acid decarboxylating)